MKLHRIAGVGLIVSAGLLGGFDRTANDTSSTRNTGTTNNTTSTTPNRADNTSRNTADRDSTTKTPLDQSNTDVATRITADIRKAIMDDKSMSTNAQNCKIITDSAGVVTLRGPVASQAEKDSIAAKAKAVSGVTSVVNELEVK